MAPEPPAPSAEPWAASDVTSLVWTALVGVVGLVVGYLAVSGSVGTSTQFISTALAAGAVAVAGLGNGVWLATGSRAVRHRRTQVEARALAISVALAEGTPTVPIPALNESDFVTVAGTARYHRPGCILVHAKAVVSATAEEHRAAGRQACPICEEPA